MDLLDSRAGQLVIALVLLGVTLRLALVVWRRERAIEELMAESPVKRADLVYGAGAVRTLAVAAVVLMVAVVVLAVLRMNGPLDSEQMDALLDEVGDSYDAEGLEEPPDPTVADLQDRIRDAGTDPDDVRIVPVAPGWVSYGGDDGSGIRFQLSNADGDHLRCLEVTWTARSGPAVASTAYDVEGQELSAPDSSFEAPQDVVC